MNIHTFAAALMVVAGVSIAAPAESRAQDLGITLGTHAPAATVTTLAGARANLSQFVGKEPVLLEFWATWCPNCKELEPTMRAAAAKYGKRVRFVRVAVNVNEKPALVKAYVAKYKLAGEHFYDTDGAATDAYDVPATSYVVILDRAGNVAYTGLGGKQDLSAAITKVLQ
jgi:thiol-disulfide isomerase/thioredoxin